MKKIILALFFVFNIFSQEMDFTKIAKHWHKTMFLKLRFKERDYVKNWILYRIDKAHKVFSGSDISLSNLDNFFKADTEQRNIQLIMDHNASESTKYINSLSISIFKEIVIQKLKNFDNHKEFSLIYKEAQIEAVRMILEYYEALLFVIHKNLIQSNL